MVVTLWYKMMNVDFKFGVFIYLFVIEGDNTGCCFFCSCDGSWTPLFSPASGDLHAGSPSGDSLVDFSLPQVYIAGYIGRHLRPGARLFR